MLSCSASFLLDNLLVKNGVKMEKRNKLSKHWNRAFGERLWIMIGKES
jgi:hypothetical protein